MLGLTNEITAEVQGNDKELVDDPELITGE
jgi:hypothetical protein